MAPSLSITNPVLNQPKHSKPNRYSPENLREILGLHKGCLRVFSVPQQSIRPGPSFKYRYRFSANTDTLLQIQISEHLRFGHVTRMFRKDWRGKACWLHPYVDQCPDGNMVLTIHGPVLVLSQ